MPFAIPPKAGEIFHAHGILFCPAKAKSIVCDSMNPLPNCCIDNLPLFTNTIHYPAVLPILILCSA